MRGGHPDVSFRHYTFNQAAEEYAEWRDGTRRRTPCRPAGSKRPYIALIARGEAYAIRLYDTDIITYYPDGSIAVEAYDSPTTRAYYHAFGLHVYSAIDHHKGLAGRWYIDHEDNAVAFGGAAGRVYHFAPALPGERRSLDYLTGNGRSTLTVDGKATLPRLTVQVYTKAALAMRRKVQKEVQPMLKHALLMRGRAATGVESIDWTTTFGEWVMEHDREGEPLLLVETMPEELSWLIVTRFGTEPSWMDMVRALVTPWAAERSGLTACCEKEDKIVGA